ncbi:hypothetical protein AMJ47_03530 [Parcubacteria bacterium DG_72]|nr:MAG: hypothetical protein AMJ47_03530 [Parcubacteria bacterium DG_72]
MEDKTKKLSKLIADDELNIDILSGILEPFVKISPKKKQIIILPDFLKLVYKDAIIVMLLGFKVLKELGLRETEMVGPKEISMNCGINLSTVKNSLRDLEEDRIATSVKGKYTIPNFLLYNLKDKFSNLELGKAIKRASEKRKRTGARFDFSRIGKVLTADPTKFAGSFYEFLTEKKGEYLKKSLILIKLVKDQFNIDGLTTAEITKLLHHLRVPMIHQSNISTALGCRESLKYVFKEPTNRKKTYIYKLTSKGDVLVSNIIKK